MMNKNLHIRKWRALILMVLGAVLITNENKPASLDMKLGMGMVDFLVGIAACLLEITLSGAISVYFEKVLKRENTPHTVSVCMHVCMYVISHKKCNIPCMQEFQPCLMLC
jgi:hypothetical protein